MENNYVYINHIKEAMVKIKKYLMGVSHEEFAKNSLLIDGVVRELEIIGEAANNIEQSFKDKHREVPWLKIRGMRNSLIHEYFGVDINIVWNTCEDDLPRLNKIINGLLKDNR